MPYIKTNKFLSVYKFFKALKRLEQNILLLFFIVGIINLNGQENCNIKLSGVVIDSFSNTSLDFCLIEINKSKPIYTNKNGEFSITNLCPQKYNIHVSHLDCEHIHIVLDLVKDTTIVIYLDHIMQEISTVRVNAIKDINKLRINPTNNNFGKSISEMASDIVGVDLLKTGLSISKPIINGLHSNRVILINNEIRQEGQNWGIDHAPEIDANGINEIQLIKGGDALRYAGDAVGGVIITTPKSVFNEREKTSFNLTNIISSNGRGNNSGISFGKKIWKNKPLYFRVNISNNFAGNLKTPSYYLSNTGTKEQNFSLQLGYIYKKNKIEAYYSNFNNQTAIFKGAFIENSTDLTNAIKSNKPLVESGFSYKIDRPKQVVGHQLIKLKNLLQINASNSLEMIVSYQRNHRQEYDVLRNKSSFKGADFNYFINTFTGDFSWNKKQFHGINFRTGINLSNQKNAYSGRFVIPGYIQNSIAYYFTSNLSYKKWKYEAAARYDMKLINAYIWSSKQLSIEKLNFKGATYFISAKYNFSKYKNIILSHSSTWRPPAINELYINGLHQGLASLEIGDKNLLPERAFNQTVEFNYENKKWHFQGEAYYKYIENFMNLTPSNQIALTIRGAFPVFEYKQYNIYMTGVNYYIKYNINKHFQIENSLSYILASIVKNQLPVALMPPLNVKTKLLFNNKYFKLDAEWIYCAKQSRYIENSDYLPPPPSYQLFNAYLSKKIDLKKQSLTIGINYLNIGNTTYRNYLNRFRYFTDELGTNIQFKIIYSI